MRQKVNPIVFFLILGFLLLSQKNYSQSTSKKLETAMQTFADVQHFNGSVLVARNGEVLFKKGYGLANVEWKIENSPTTKFRIASLTKQFTAVLIIKLQSEHKINLDKNICDYLDWYPENPGKQVTINQLLHHTAGIPNYTERSDYFTEISMHNYTPKDFVEKYCTAKTEFVPGTQYRYSNSNYYILGAIIEAVTGKTFAEVLQESIFNPCNMKDSGLDNPEKLVYQKATGYDFNFGTLTPAAYINMSSTIYAAGGIYSTVEDLHLWNKNLYHGKLLSETERNILLTIEKGTYACGLNINKAIPAGMSQPLTFIGHNGSINGFHSDMSYTKEQDLEVILLNNTSDGNFSTDLNSISIYIFNLVNNLSNKKILTPIGRDMAQKAINENVESSISFYKNMKKSKVVLYDFSNAEADINTLGYILWGKKETKAAIEMFYFNTIEYPNSANTFDSYAEALASNGQTKQSIINYEKSVSLNPDNQHAKEQLILLKK